MKINKNHKGKEFQSYFRFIGKVKRSETGIGENKKQIPIFQTTKTKTNKDRRVLQFDVETNKWNNIRVELAGMEKEFAYLYSSTDKKSHRVAWNDRHNKSKYPNATYHLMESEWDLSEEFSKKFSEGDWVEVKGKYEFDKFVTQEGNEFLAIKRIISSVEKIEDGYEVVLRSGDKINYVCDFESPEFIEVNHFSLEIGIVSTYEDESNPGEVDVNAVFLQYGKDRSVPKDVKLSIFRKEAEQGQKTMADIFLTLEKGDFIEVVGIDNNRPIFSDVVEEDSNDNDPFAELDESEKVKQTKSAISGTKKGLEITAVVGNTYQKELLTEEEMIIPEDIFREDIVVEIGNNDLPF